MPRRSNMNVAVVFLIAIFQCVDSANWAQSSGYIDQNTATPYLPSPASPHWQARYGMAIITYQPTVATTDGSTPTGYVYILGGDTYDNEESRRNIPAGLMDTNWYNGYKNDVWRMSGTDWVVESDIRLKTQYKQKIPRVRADVTWEELTPGLLPTPGTTYEDWLICEDGWGERYAAKKAAECTGTDKPSVMWSPRRHHAAVYFNSKLWVLGGRSREFIELPEDRAVGGIMGPRIKDITYTAENGQAFTNIREASVLKSDVWSSSDGITWTLVTPGCRAPQFDLVASGNAHERKYGTQAYACKSSLDCYGSESCDQTRGTCVCDMWSPREQHAVASYGDYMYVSGGYTSRLYSELSNCGPYACGDTDASAYRYYLSDIWRSTNGKDWTPVTTNAFDGLGRGGHSMLVIPDSTKTEYYLWVIGGRGGDNSGKGYAYYYNDIWKASLSGNNPVTWVEETSVTIPWSPRTGHVAIYESGGASNLYTRALYVIGGSGPRDPEKNNVQELGPRDPKRPFLDDVWVWRMDKSGEGWQQDYTTAEMFGTGTGSNFHYSNSSPSVAYISENSPVSQLQRWWVPTKIAASGTRLQLRPYLTEDKVKMLHQVGIYTVKDLAEANKYDILKLRGYDIPQVPLNKRMNFKDVCDFKALAEAVMKKCTVDTTDRLYAGQRQMPWNIIPVFGGPVPAEQNVLWHGRDNYDFMMGSADDPVTLIDQWDGCKYVPQIQGRHGPNVNGIGYVDQVTNIRNPARELQELVCKQYPGPRAWHVGTYFENRVYIFGGKVTEREIKADSWYRDAVLPTTKFTKKPTTKSSEYLFQFSCDEAGCAYEYRIWDPYNYKELRPWTRVVHKTDVSWLSWRMGGPGNGKYSLYVRSIDPAGNKDERFYLSTNVHVWNYVSPTPWDIIFGALIGFAVLLFASYLEYKRRQRKAAMERYAMKRMRRKFKAMQRDIDGRAVDWRTLYNESKEAGLLEGKRRRKKREKRDLNKEKRDKEKKKREKEKEKIKRKLKAARDEKKSIKSGKAASEKAKDKERAQKSGATPVRSGASTARGGAAPSGPSGAGAGAGAGAATSRSKGTTAREGGGGRTKRENNTMEFRQDPEKEKGGRAGAGAGGPSSKGGGGGASGGPRYKDYEQQAKPQAGNRKKDYETGVSGTVVADDEAGTKQRKSNKRFKDYEIAGGAGESKSNKGGGGGAGESKSAKGGGGAGEVKKDR